MRFSVVVLDYASWPLTLRCVGEAMRAAEADGAELEVVVVDNNEGGEPPALPGGAKLVRTEGNLGFAGGANRGVAASSGEVVVFLNPDTRIGAGFFRRVGAFLGGSPRVGIVGPRVLDPDGGLQLSARRDVSLLTGLFGRTSLLTRLFPNSAFVQNQFPGTTGKRNPVAVDWVAGACMAVRREVLDGVGGFDERFFMYFEDADLCRRAREAGWMVFYLPDVEATHAAGGSSPSRARAIWMLHKSAFLYHRKHGAHGPLNLYSGIVLLGLAVRALAKLAAAEVRRGTRSLGASPSRGRPRS